MTVDTELRGRLERHMDQLPILPAVVSQLMVLDHESVDYFENVLELVSADPTFSTRVLSAANAAESSPRSPVTSVRSSLARLGSSGASSLILAMAVSRVFIPRDPWEKSLWRHSLQVAGATRELVLAARDAASINADDAYTAGLLHDIGRFVIFQEAPDALRQIDDGSWDAPEGLVEREMSICGLTHGELGQMACQRWSLPELLGEVVLRHHDVDISPRGSEAEVLAIAVRFADLAMFPSAMPGTPGFDEADLDTIEAELMPKLPDFLHMSGEALQRVIRKSAADTEATCQVLGLG